MPALLTPEQAALATVDGFRTGKFEIHYRSASHAS